MEIPQKPTWDYTAAEWEALYWAPDRPSIQELADRIGCARDTVMVALWRAKVPVRSGQEQRRITRGRHAHSTQKRLPRALPVITEGGDAA